MVAAASESGSESARQRLVGSVGKCVMGFAAAATALSSVCFDSPALAESLTVAFPVSRAPEVNFVYVFCCYITCLFSLYWKILDELYRMSTNYH